MLVPFFYFGFFQLKVKVTVAYISYDTVECLLKLCLYWFLWLQVFSSVNDSCTWNATNYGLAFSDTYWAILTLFTVYDHTMYKDSGLVSISIFFGEKKTKKQTKPEQQQQKHTRGKKNQQPNKKKTQPRILFLDRQRAEGRR